RCRRLKLCLHPVAGVQDPVGGDLKPVTGGSEGDRFWRPVKQPHPQFLLELGYRGGKGWLCDRSSRCRLGETPGFRDGGEVPDLIEFHGHKSYLCASSKYRILLMSCP